MRPSRLLAILGVTASGALAVAVMDSLADVARPSVLASAEVDSRSQDAASQAALLRVAAAKVDGRIAALDAAEQRLRAELAARDAARAAAFGRLARVYESMPPEAAAARLALLPDQVRFAIAAAMRPSALAGVLAAMPAGQSEVLTEALAAQWTSASGAAGA